MFIAVGAMQSCAILDGYKDNQHAWYAHWLTKDKKELIDQGSTLRIMIETQKRKGQLLVLKGSSKYGRYNFVETGEWKEETEYSSGKGVSITETTYESFGNILSRRLFEKGTKDKEYYLRETWSSQMEIFSSDTTL